MWSTNNRCLFCQVFLFLVSDSLIIKYFVDNGDDGKAKTLSSKTKKCTMLFPVKVTKTAASKKHDMTYEKSFNPNGIVKILYFLLRQRMRWLWLWLQQWWFDISCFNINSILHTYSKMRTIYRGMNDIIVNKTLMRYHWITSNIHHSLFTSLKIVLFVFI